MNDSINSNLVLTPEELEIIKAKRAKEQEAQMKAAKEHAERIERLHKTVKETLACVAIKNEQTRLFYEKLENSFWTLDTKTVSKEFKAEYYDSEKDENFIIHKEVVEYEVVSISGVCKKTNFKFRIDVNEVYKNTGSGYWSKSVPTGEWAMFLSGTKIDWGYEKKPIKKAATLQKKVDQVINAQLSMMRKLSAIEEAVEHGIRVFAEKYPTAKIFHSSDWVYSGEGRRAGRKVELLNIEFENGIKVDLEVTEEKRYYRRSIYYPKDKDVLAALSNIVW